MSSRIRFVLEVTNSFLTPELINEVLLPEDLLDPRTDAELKERYYFIFHSIFGPMGIEVAKVLGRESLTVNELSVISERVEAYLKQSGF